MSLKDKMKAKVIQSVMDSLPPDTFDDVPAQVEEFINMLLSKVKVADGEKAAILIIEGNSGYLVNIVVLGEDSSITIVDRYTLKEFFDNIVNIIKNGGYIK